MKSEKKKPLKSDMHYVLFWQTLNNLRHISYFGYPCYMYFELFPNDALSVDYSRPRQKMFYHIYVQNKVNTNIGMVQSLRKNIS